MYPSSSTMQLNDIIKLIVKYLAIAGLQRTKEMPDLNLESESFELMPSREENNISTTECLHFQQKQYHRKQRIPRAEKTEMQVCENHAKDLSRIVRVNMCWHV